jgi:hypothetical protein
MSFSARWILNPLLGEVQPSVQQASESRRGIGQRDVVDAVLDLASIAVVVAALGRSRIVDAANSPGMRVVGGNELLAAISQSLLIPNHRFEKPLQGSWRQTPLSI